ncbi:MAG TPA: histidine kinase [Rhodoglobus sp.]|nr:histidine kinase [Rhodoglobus sp.]
MAVTTLRPRLEAWLRIAAIIAAVALLSVSTALGATIYEGDIIFVFAGALLHAGAVAAVLVRPRTAAVMSLIGAPIIMLAAHHGGLAPWPWAVTTMITQALVLAGVGFRARSRYGVATLALSVLISGLISMWIEPVHSQDAVAVDLVVFTTVGGVGLIAGIVLREWGTISAQLAAQRRLTDDERARRLMAEEKTRIARELHDVIAHSMSIISVQATSAPFRHPQADLALRREFEDIATSSRRALAEMRSLLGVLRDPDAPIARTPQPHLSGIPELVAQSERSGVDIRLLGAECLTDDGVSEVTGLTAYRIVQEALSNVIRHAPDTPVTVRITRDRDLGIAVENGPGERVGAADAPGLGLLGMRERAASVGGTFAYGPTAVGGYEVRATLPLVPEEATA